MCLLVLCENFVEWFKWYLFFYYDTSEYLYLVHHTKRNCSRKINYSHKITKLMKYKNFNFSTYEVLP